MKTSKIAAGGLLLTALALLVSPTLARKGKGGNPAPQPVISEVEVQDLKFMREEEKLARDTYLTLLEDWGNAVFENIAGSEQRHMDAILNLLDKYGIDDPALGFGEFANAELQHLFNALVTAGQQSELDALMVGALIEEVDMEDIVAAMSRTDKADILSVYGNLLAGSENHLRAFVRNIEAITGEPYEAQHITQEEVDAILGR